MSADHCTRRKFILDSTILLVTVTSLSALSSACDLEEAKRRKRLAHLQIENSNIILDLDQRVYFPLHATGNGIKLDLGAQTKPLIVTRVSPGEVAAFSSQCTHAGAEVLLPEQGRLICSSGHGAVFDLRGKVLAGPARSNLDSYEAHLADNHQKIIVRYFS
jgi:Rieske Fe-S protein